MTYTILCWTCGKTFECETPDGRYCKDCKPKNPYNKKKFSVLICKKCGLPFYGLLKGFCYSCLTKKKEVQR